VNGDEGVARVLQAMSPDCCAHEWSERLGVDALDVHRYCQVMGLELAPTPTQDDLVRRLRRELRRAQNRERHVLRRVNNLRRTR